MPLKKKSPSTAVERFSRSVRVRVARILRPKNAAKLKRSSKKRRRKLTTIDFRANGNLKQYRGDGWSRSEPWGTWTDGDTATLRLGVVPTKKSDLILAAQIRPFLTPERPRQDVDVLVNGRLAGSRAFYHPRSGWSGSGRVAAAPSAKTGARVPAGPSAMMEWELRIPADLVEGSKAIEIAFVVKTACSPAELGLSSDSRRLGIGFVRATLSTDRSRSRIGRKFRDLRLAIAIWRRGLHERLQKLLQFLRNRYLRSWDPSKIAKAASSVLGVRNPDSWVPDSDGAPRPNFYSTPPVIEPAGRGQRVLYYYVAHTILCPVNSGVQRITRSLGPAFADTGEAVRYVKWSAARQRFVLINTAELDHLGRWHGPKLADEERLTYPSPSEKAASIEKEVVHPGDWLIVPEVTHLTFDDEAPTLDVLMEARRLGLKVGILFYDSIPLRRKELAGMSRPHQTYMQQLLLADLLVPISEWSARDLASYFHIHEAAANLSIPKIVPLHLPGEMRAARRATSNGSGSRRIILSVGSLEIRKNQVALVEAFERFCASRAGDGWELLLVGSMSADVTPEINRFLERNANIRVLGHVSDDELDGLYRSCAFTVFPSVEEGFGMPIVESLWYGKPCICANFGAMAEAARGGGCLTVNTRKVDALASAIKSLASDKRRRQQLSQEAASRDITTWRDYAKMFGALLDKADDPLARIGAIYYWVDYTATFPSNSGIQRVVRSLARALIQQGFKLIPVKWDGKKRCFYSPTRAELHYLALWNGPKADSWSGWRDPSRASPDDWVLVAELTNYLPPQGHADLRKYTEQHGLRCSFIFHDNIPWKLASIYTAAITAAHARYMASLAEFDKVFPNSDHSKAELISFFAHTRCRLHSFSHRFQTCILPGEFLETPRVHVAKEDQSTPVKILFVGTVEPRKNHLALLAAFAQLRKTTKIAIELVLVGSPSDSHAELAAQVHAIAETIPGIRWERRCSDAELQKLYAECDFTVYPSIEEGFGLPILESLWNARPCICGNHGAMAEAAKDGGCLTADISDPSALADAMQLLVESKVLRRNLAQAAINRTMKTWHEYAREVAMRLAADRPASRSKSPGTGAAPSAKNFYSEFLNLAPRPLLSICITTYNRASWLAVSLENLVRILPTPSPDVEIVICDNASSDSTPQITEPFLHRPDFRFVRNSKNVGMLGNLRVTAHHARGRYIWILGDDDLILPGSIERIVKIIRSRPDLALVYLNYAYTRENSPNSIEDIDNFLNSSTPIVAPRRDVYGSVREICTRSENFFTAIYCLVFRRDHALRAYSQNTEGRPFSSLLTCMPTTYHVLNHMMDEPACWLGKPQVVINMNVSWMKYAPLWILERIPEALDLAERMGAAAAGVDRWRIHNLPGFAHFWREILEHDEVGNVDYFSAIRAITRIRHLQEFDTVAPALKVSYEKARMASNPAADVPVSALFP